MVMVADCSFFFQSKPCCEELKIEASLDGIGVSLSFLILLLGSSNLSHLFCSVDLSTVAHGRGMDPTFTCSFRYDYLRLSTTCALSPFCVLHHLMAYFVESWKEPVSPKAVAAIQTAMVKT
jgi:hypothetical protein